MQSGQLHKSVFSVFIFSHVPYLFRVPTTSHYFRIDFSLKIRQLHCTARFVEPTVDKVTILFLALTAHKTYVGVLESTQWIIKRVHALLPLSYYYTSLCISVIWRGASCETWHDPKQILRVFCCTLRWLAACCRKWVILWLSPGEIV